jgi:hypothetical protein
MTTPVHQALNKKFKYIQTVLAFDDNDLQRVSQLVSLSLKREVHVQGRERQVFGK